MTPSPPLDADLKEWIQLCEWSDCGPHSKELGAFLKSIRTALQDERGRAREAALDEVARLLQQRAVAAFDKGIKHQSVGDLSAGSDQAHRVDELGEAVKAIRALKSQSPPCEAQGWPPLDDDLREILGRMCFQCGHIAQAFRKYAGAEIKTKAEDEQAFVIHWLVGLYLKHGKEWRKHAADELPLPAPPLPTTEG